MPDTPSDENFMKKVLLFIVIFVIVMVGILIYLPKFYEIKLGQVYQNLIKKGEELPSPVEKISMPEKTLEGKSMAMIIAYRNFRDEEYFRPKEILEEAGVEVKTVSTQKGIAMGADGGEVEVDLLINELNPAEFDGVVFIGGPGAIQYLDNENSYKVAQETVSQNKILASICVSPVILAKAGVLSGKRATVWSSPLDKSPVRILEKNEAIYQEKSVVVDGKIVTANGPAAAEEFAKAIITALK